MSEEMTPKTTTPDVMYIADNGITQIVDGVCRQEIRLASSLPMIDGGEKFIRADLAATGGANLAYRGLCEIREIYCNMEGFVPETAGEGYVLQEIKRMYDTAIEHIKLSQQKPVEAGAVGALAEHLKNWRETETLDGKRVYAHEILSRYSDAIETALSAAPVEGQDKVDLTKCPNCGGEADNGHDRCMPPNPYYCTKCEASEGEKDG